MIGGGFRGNFPHKGNKKKKDGDKPAGPIHVQPKDPSWARGAGPRILPNTSAPAGQPEGGGQGPRVLPPPMQGQQPVGSQPQASPTQTPQYFRGGGPRILSDNNYRPQRAFAPNPVNEIKENEALWNGIIHGYSGYAKANREILRRLSPFIKIGIAADMPWSGAETDPSIIELWTHHQNVTVSSRAPRITFLPPTPQPSARVRVIYTMMETEIVHQDMIKVMNENFDECWVPTRWNAETFRRSGLKMPIYTMPLGVDPAIYAPGNDVRMPQATLMTTVQAGKVETPKGFLFIYVFQPSFRKGLDVLISAFHEAFYGDQTVGLVLGTTAHSLENSGVLPRPDLPIKVWAVYGNLSERDMAAMYRACHVYVCTSRGEGWNLPMMEAAACGLPVIVPRTSVHPELVPEGCGLFFDATGMKQFPGSKAISPWFDGIEFPDYGANSHKQLVDLLRKAKSEYSSLTVMGRRYMNVVRSRYSWGIAAKNVSDRIKAICL